MALKMEFANLIIPVETVIRLVGQEAWDQYYEVISPVMWHDGILWREGHMNYGDFADSLNDWEARGLTPLREENGQKIWQDVCLVNSHHGPSFPCDWIEYDPEQNIIWMKGTEPGEVVGGE